MFVEEADRSWIN